MGQVHIFDHYEDALRVIAREGLPAYARRVTRPYLTVIQGHFDANTRTYTERLVGQVWRAGPPANEQRR